MIKKEKINILSKQMIKTTILFLLVSSLASIFYLLEYYDDDAFFHLERLINLSKQIKEGVWKPIVNPFYLDGYGYGVNLFYGNIYLYPFAWLISIGMKETVAFFLLNMSIIFLSLWIAYFSANKLFLLFDKQTSLLQPHQQSVFFALTTTLFFSRVFNVAVRGAIGEIVASAFLPIVLLGIFRFLKEKPAKLNFYLIMGFSLTLITHLVSFVINGVFFLVILILNYKDWFFKKEKWVELLTSILISIGITASFLFPLIEQLLSNEFFYQTHNPHGLLSERAFAILPTNSLLISCAIQVVFIVGITIGFKYSHKLKQEEQLIAKSLMLFIYSLTLATNLFPWQLFDHLFPITMIQFPFRLLNWSSLFFGIGTTCFFLTQSKFFNFNFSSFRKKIIIILGVFVLSISSFLVEKKLLEEKRNEIQTKEEWNAFIDSLGLFRGNSLIPETIRINIGQGEYLPNRLDISLLKTRDCQLVINNSKTENVAYKINGMKQEWALDSSIEGVQTIQIPIIYYKGYEVRLNDQTTPYSQSLNGLIQIEFSQPISLDKDTVLTVNYQGTTLQSMSYWISLGTFTLVVVTMIKKRKGFS